MNKYYITPNSTSALPKKTNEQVDMNLSFLISFATANESLCKAEIPPNVNADFVDVFDGGIRAATDCGTVTWLTCGRIEVDLHFLRMDYYLDHTKDYELMGIDVTTPTSHEPWLEVEWVAELLNLYKLAEKSKLLIS